MSEKTVTILQTEYDELLKIKKQRNQYLLECFIPDDYRQNNEDLPNFFGKLKSSHLKDEELLSIMKQGNVFNCDQKHYKELLLFFLDKSIDKKWFKTFEYILTMDDFSEYYENFTLDAIEDNKLEFIKIMFDKLEINPMDLEGYHKAADRRRRYKNKKQVAKNCYPLLVAIQNRNIEAMKIILKNKHVKVQSLNWSPMAYIFEIEGYEDPHKQARHVTEMQVSIMMEKYNKGGLDHYKETVSETTKKKVKDTLPKIDLAISILEGL